MARSRLDSELVRRGLARSREQAAQLVADGRVRVGGVVAGKPATQVDHAAAVVVSPAAQGVDYVSRGGHKLAGALDAFCRDGLEVAGLRCLDAGASTGGFTDVLLRAGASQVVAVDVGYGQLAWSLRNDPRVLVRERINVRALSVADVGDLVDLVVADLSFISLKLVLAPLISCSSAAASFVLMVKPQFEVGRENIGDHGVVRDPALRARAVADVAAAAFDLGLGVAGVVASPLPGPQGNVEYFLWLRAGEPALEPDRLAQAIAEGPH